MLILRIAGVVLRRYFAPDPVRRHSSDRVLHADAKQLLYQPIHVTRHPAMLVEVIAQELDLEPAWLFR